MNKLTIKKIVEFRSKKSDKSKKFFAAKLKIDLKKAKEADGGGGDYWISCVSALKNVFRTNNLKLIKDKITYLEGKIELAEFERTKINYQQNIDMLHRLEDYDLKEIKPAGEIILLKKHNEDYLLNIHGFEVEAKPDYVFTFEHKGNKEVGAVWFIAQKDGFSKTDLGMFTDIMYQYLEIHFAADYPLNPRYCIAIDVYNNTQVNYAELQKGEIDAVLEPTLVEISGLM